MALELRNFTFDYGTDDSVVLKRLNLQFPTSGITLICGSTGSGKTTLLQVLNLLVPSFSAGRASGSILLNQKEILGLGPADVAQEIGFINQQPDSFFVSETVIEELAFGMEQLGIPKAEMLQRITGISQVLDLEPLHSEPLTLLSAGQKQRVAIGAAMVAGQKILLLDEPTSALDDESAAGLLQLLRKLRDEHGVTILIAEHRFERVLSSADSVLVLKGDGSAVISEPTFESLNRHLPSWRLFDKIPARGEVQEANADNTSSLCEVREVSVQYPTANDTALKEITLEIRATEILAVKGANGSGKTSLIWAIAGLIPCAAGSVTSVAQMAVIPHNAADLLFMSSVAKELAESDAQAGAAANTTSNIFKEMIGRVNPSLHPRDLSSGQQLALVIAIQLARGAEIILLDEPTRGLDLMAKRALAKQLRNLRDQGAAIVVATHDDEFASLIADRTITLRRGRIEH